jgi:DNA-directed RNA polymerase specialized sigma24 family protein
MNTQALEFQKVYEDFQPKILRYLARLVGKSEAEDLAQERNVSMI